MTSIKEKVSTIDSTDIDDDLQYIDNINIDEMNNIIIPYKKQYIKRHVDEKTTETCAECKKKIIYIDTKTGALLCWYHGLLMSRKYKKN